MYKKQNEFDVTLETYNSLIPKLENLRDQLVKQTCFLGFDGYVDSLYSLVLTRENADKWKRMDGMATFGGLVQRVAGSSANVERVLKRKISGGFAPNSCKAINGLGITIKLVAALGYPQIDPTFNPLEKENTIETISFANPGETAGLEFDDGKVMLTDFENINKITWDTLIERIGLDRITDKIAVSNLMGFGHWSLIPNLGEIWTHLLYDVFPNVENIGKKLFFVDLADIKKRTKEDIFQMIEILKKVDSKMPVMLSLNDQEAIDISKTLETVDDIDPTKKNYEAYIEAGKNINQELKFHYLVIHSPHFATISTRSDHYWVTEGYTSQPRFTTGAGDHFHSGVAAGLSCGLTPPESLLIGNALTAVFVRTGNSPNFDELRQFIKNYMDYIEKDNPNFP